METCKLCHNKFKDYQGKGENDAALAIRKSEDFERKPPLLNTWEKNAQNADGKAIKPLSNFITQTLIKKILFLAMWRIKIGM